MRAREECRGEKCRRADIPELELARLECGSLLPLLRGMDSRPSDRVVGGAGIAKAAALRNSGQAALQLLANLLQIVGAPTFSIWNAGFEVAG